MIKPQKRLLATLIGVTFCTLIQAAPVGSDTVGDIVISGQDEDGNAVQLTYNKDRLLVRSQIAGVGVDYKYSRDNLLAYATADNGFGYTVSRDRGQRITQIVGQNSAVMTVSYPGNKKVPIQISMVTPNGQYVTPYVQRAGTRSASSTEYSLQALDMRLAEIFEAYAFTAIDYADIYMRPLSKKETVAAMANVLLEHYARHQEWEKIIALSSLLLEYAPKDVSLMLFKGSASGKLAKQRFEDVYPAGPNTIPVQERAYFNELTQNNELMFKKAEVLGWRVPDLASRANYIQAVNRAKSGQQQ